MSSGVLFRLVLGIGIAGAILEAAAGTGSFDGQGDVGKTSRPGKVEYDQASGSYLLGAAGENMWFTNDAFFFIWKRSSGDFDFESTLQWLGSGGNAHRKACLMVRQGLEADSAYVDVAVHGDGLTSLQFREARGGFTHEIQANVKAPARVGIQRQADSFFLTLPDSGGKPAPLGGPFMRLRFSDPVYVGLALCAHDDKAWEQARFSEAKLESKQLSPQEKGQLHSAIEIVPIASKDRRVVLNTAARVEAPNWSRDGKFLIYNSEGRLFRLPVTGGTSVPIGTGFAVRCNNDHGFSPDGSRLAISDQSRGGKSLIYLLPASGGEPKLVTPSGPSYWHGWSPDGSTLVYCAERDGEFDIYSISAEGGEERRLTTAAGLDDGPDYSADGKYIYFNSERSGTMQIWRMKPDGSEQEQVTSDGFNNWFAHPSPDGKWLVFLSYAADVRGHPENQPVSLRLMPLSGGPVQELARLFGGQGTLNVPSWSPDSRQVAFVSYELVRSWSR
jgi:hypothetical protein